MMNAGAANWPQATSSSVQSTAYPTAVPTEPTLSAKSAELNKWISEAEDLLTQIDEKLFGPRPAESVGHATSPVVIDNAIALASSRVASLCGWLRTISGKL